MSDELHTEVVSAAMSAEPLFKVKARLDLPEDLPALSAPNRRGIPLR